MEIAPHINHLNCNCWGEDQCSYNTFCQLFTEPF